MPCQVETERRSFVVLHRAAPDNMGLEGVEVLEKMASFTEPPIHSFQGHNTSWDLENNANCTDFTLFGIDLNETSGQSLLMQAQALIRKSHLYQKIDEALRKLQVFQPNVYQNVPHDPQASSMSASCNSYNSSNNNKDGGDELVTSFHRDSAVLNLRFLNIFYGYNPNTFALAVNLLDRLLGKVKAHQKYLSSIATCCFLIAVKTMEGAMRFPNLVELIRLSQCGGTVQDLLHMERLILDKLGWEVAGVTPLTFLHHFFEVLSDRDPKLLADASLPATLVSHLEVLLGHFEFTKYRADLFALAFLSFKLQQLDLLSNADHFNGIVELQYYCQMSDEDLLECRCLVMHYLSLYSSQTSKLPRGLRLNWSVSRRTLSKAKPSTRVLLDLETIMEDEDADGNLGSEEDDSGVFDSENDESELNKAARALSNIQLTNNNGKSSVCSLGKTCPYRPYAFQ